MRLKTFLVLIGVAVAITIIALTFVPRRSLGLWTLGLLVFAALILLAVRYFSWTQEFMSPDPEEVEWEVTSLEVYIILGLSVAIILVALLVQLSSSYSDATQTYAAGASGIALGVLLPPLPRGLRRAVKVLLLAVGIVVVCGGLFLLFSRPYSDASKWAAGALGFIFGAFGLGGFLQGQS